MTSLKISGVPTSMIGFLLCVYSKAEEERRHLKTFKLGIATERQLSNLSLIIFTAPVSVLQT